ncbi:MAG TPA: outer membrane beta-barrel protein [Flavipsychrobacter sp.]|nr:outer membrane beta-barrel protein [Flavipsychrobacter sp.]
MKQLLYLTLFIVSAWVGKAQQFTIQGTVKDVNKTPLEAATIVLLKDSNTVIKTEATNLNGGFLLEHIDAGNYALKVILGNYETYTKTDLQVSGNTVLNDVVLKASSQQLNEVTMRAQRPLIEIKPDKLILNVESSITSAGSSAMDVLQKAPGVRVDQNDNISLKGKNGVMIWIDGKQTPLSGTDLANVLKSMPSNSIDKIEIISNPGARYDAAGNAGIINIKTKKDQRMGMNGTATVSYGQGIYPKYGAGLTLNYRNRKFNAYASYNYAERYWFNHLMLDRKFLDSKNGDAQQFRYDQDNYAFFDFKNHIASGGIDYALTKKTTLGLSGNYSTNRFNPRADNASRALDGENKLLYYFNTTGRHENFYYNYSTNAFLKHAFTTNGKELSIDFDYAAFGNQSNQNFVTHYTTAEGNSYLPDYFLKSDLTGKTDIKSVKADYTHPVTNSFKMEAGTKLSWVLADNEPLFYEKINDQYELDAKRSNHFLYNENINAVYINANNEWKKWATQIGLRLENTNANWEQRTIGQKFDTAYTQLFPSVAVQYHLHARHDLGLTLSRRIERPNYSQLNPFKYFIDKTTYREGYPYLYPASYYSAELSHTYNQRFITSFSYGINKGYITEVIQPSETEDSVTVQTNKNLDEMLFIGMSGSYNFQITKWWSNVTNFNAYYARYKGNIANTPLDNGRPTFDINTNNSFLLPKDFSAEIGGWYQARQLYGYMDVRPTWMLNFGVQKHFFSKTATLRVNVQDAFWTGYPRATSIYTGYREDFVAQRETRTVNVAFTYRFGNNKVSPVRKHRSGAEDEKSRANNNGA